jgi:hypothetical protein
MSPIEIPVLDATVQKYLLRAGTDPRCTPKVLREKTEVKMGLEGGTLDTFKPRIKKLIIKWWKEGGKEAAAAAGLGAASPVKSEPGETKVKAEPAAAQGPVPPTAEEIATWKAMKQFAKATGKGSELLASLSEINVASKRIEELSKRIKGAGYEFAGATPTAAEIEALQAGKKRSLEGEEGGPPVKKEKEG